MKYTHVDTRVAYTVLSLLCDIGGSLGLILGSTMLTVAEFGDFLSIIAIKYIKFRASVAQS